MKILITGACAVSARSVVRSLRKSEIFGNAEFVGWDMGSILYEFYEGLFDRLYKMPSVKDPSYRKFAEQILEKEKPDLVVVVPEVEVLYWSKNPFNVKYIVPPPKFSEIVISKDRLFKELKGHGLVPETYNFTPEELLSNSFECPLPYPVWIRDCAAGTASGKGALKASNAEEIKAWVKLNGGIDNFQISEFLPGGNFGCFCLFNNGNLVKLCIAERIEYIMAKVAVSGITGNTAKGRLLNDEKIRQNALKAIDIVCKKTGEKMHGLVVVDMKGDADGNPRITEINIRHVAYSSSFANAGFNISEYQALLALERADEIPPEVEKQYPPRNLILRDVDGLPIYVEDHKDIKIGEYR